MPVWVNKHSVNVFSRVRVYKMEIFRMAQDECLIRTKPTEKFRTGVIVSAIIHRQPYSTVVWEGQRRVIFVYRYKIQHKTVTNNDQNYGTESGVANSFFWTGSFSHKIAVENLAIKWPSTVADNATWTARCVKTTFSSGWNRKWKKKPPFSSSVLNTRVILIFRVHTHVHNV